MGMHQAKKSHTLEIPIDIFGIEVAVQVFPKF